MSSNLNLLHYTNRDGKNAIISSGIIKSSRNSITDAMMGPGVYMTSKKPHEYTKEKLAQNNYDGAASANLNIGKLDYYFAIWIPKSDVQKYGGPRDVYCLKKDLYLENYTWSVGFDERKSGDLLVFHYTNKEGFEGSIHFLTKELND